MSASVEEQFRAKIAVDEATECWRWTASKQTNGYARFAHDGEVLAHRWAYKHFVGAIPEGLVLDHVWSRGCRHRDCVNPLHLEPTTRVANLRRQERARRDACVHGHEFSAENTYKRPNGTRACKTCRAARKRAQSV